MNASCWRLPPGDTVAAELRRLEFTEYTPEIPLLETRSLMKDRDLRLVWKPESGPLLTPPTPFVQSMFKVMAVQSRQSGARSLLCRRKSISTTAEAAPMKR
jgi:hypothetical protein